MTYDETRDKLRDLVLKRGAGEISRDEFWRRLDELQPYRDAASASRESVCDRR